MLRGRQTVLKPSHHIWPSPATPIFKILFRSSFRQKTNRLSLSSEGTNSPLHFRFDKDITALHCGSRISQAAMAMTKICAYVLFLACLLLAACAGRIRSGAGCRCPRSSANFNHQYYKAHKVVKGFVLSQFTSCHLCDGPRNRGNAVRVYVIYTYKLFRGSTPGAVFYAQAFENLNFCGVRLRTGGTYMLNLADPRRISAASHWTRGWFVLEACQSHYNWRSLNNKQQQFLYSRTWRAESGNKKAEVEVLADGFRYNRCVIAFLAKTAKDIDLVRESQVVSRYLKRIHV